MQWRMLHEIEERLGFDEKATAAALLAAVERGWIQVDQLAEKIAATKQAKASCLSLRARRKWTSCPWYDAWLRLRVRAR